MLTYYKCWSSCQPTDPRSSELTYYKCQSLCQPTAPRSSDVPERGRGITDAAAVAATMKEAAIFSLCTTSGYRLIMGGGDALGL